MSGPTPLPPPRRKRSGMSDDGGDTAAPTSPTVRQAEAEDIYAAVIYEGLEKYSRPEPTHNQSIYATSMQADRRNYVINELVDTERSYIKTLGLLLDTYRDTMEKYPDVFTPSHLQTIFANLDDVRSLHKDFFMALKTALRSTTGRIVSTVFNASLTSMEQYAGFCSSVGKGMELVSNFCKQPGCAQAQCLEQCRQASGQKFGLSDMLKVPFQRILKYPLLLSELWKRTPDNHPDKAGLEVTLAGMKKVTAFINAAKAQTDRVADLESRIRGSLAVYATEWSMGHHACVSLSVCVGVFVYACERASRCERAFCVFVCDCSV
eukprot:m.1146774 g.1146774  ORF g.1146774 m.1146774 type:complete len:321 (+) comp24469_c1_seq13:262-1224(+)